MKLRKEFDQPLLLWLFMALLAASMPLFLWLCLELAYQIFFN